MMSVEQDDHYVFSPTISRRYLMRHPSMKWWYMMEDFFADVPVGTRLLIRRDIRYSTMEQDDIVCDYITTRVSRATFYGHWEHYYVAYRANEPSPYGYDVNAYENRYDLMSRRLNEITESEMKWSGLLPEPSDPMDEDVARSFLQGDASLSRSALPLCPLSRLSLEDLPASLLPLPPVPMASYPPMPASFPRLSSSSLLSR